jgi:hypothetical protein
VYHLESPPTQPSQGYLQILVLLCLIELVRYDVPGKVEIYQSIIIDVSCRHAPTHINVGLGEIIEGIIFGEDILEFDARVIAAKLMEYFLWLYLHSFHYCRNKELQGLIPIELSSSFLILTECSDKHLRKF